MCRFSPLTFAADQQWSRDFFPASSSYLSTVINAALVTPDGKLIYAGRGIPTDDYSVAASIVVQNGYTRTPLATGHPLIYSLARDGEILYAGGEFTSISGVAATNLARWDGFTWQPVGGGITGGPVHAIAVHDGAIYAGGGFTNAGGLTVSGLARWDGTNWTSPGFVQPTYGWAPAVRAIQFIGDSLYIAGRFNAVGGIAATNIAEFMQNSWRPLGSGLSSYSYGVYSLAAHASGELFAGGDFHRAGDIAANYVAKWNGSEWSALKKGVRRESAGMVRSIYCMGNSLYVAGNLRYIDGVVSDWGGYGVARWDGENWDNLGIPFYEGASAITADATNVYAAGPFRSPMYPRDSYGQMGIARYDGNRWHVPGGVDRTAVGGAVVNGKLRAVSREYQYNDLQNIADWDGATWKLIGTAAGNSISQLLHKNGVTYIIGRFSKVNDVPAANLAAYDGVNWRAVGPGLVYPVRIDFLGTNLVAVDGNGLHIWTGQTMQDVPVPFAGAITTIAVDGNVLYIALRTNLPDYKVSSEIARWDGEQWSNLSFQGNGEIWALAVVDHHLYAGGYFNEAAGAPAKMIAHWDGTVWRELGGGVTSNGIYNSTSGTVTAFQPDGEGGLFVGGDFSKLGSVLARAVAHWDGLEWRTLGSGISGYPNSFHLDGRDLYVFGLIASAGGYQSSSIAKWRMAELELIPRGLNADKTFTLEARGVVGKRFVVQTSTSLDGWVNISTNTLTTNKLTIRHNGFSAGQSFYRLISAE